MINDLSLKEKIGQMMMVGINGTEVDDRVRNLILNYKIGGVILYKKNYKTYDDMVKIIADLKELNSCNKIPLFIAIDQEGGRVNRMPPEFHNLLSAYRLVNTKNTNVIKEAGEITGRILYESGYNMNFAPVMDVLNNETSEAIGNRCYGNNPEDVSEYAIPLMRQLQSHKIIPVVKHFPGQGAAKIDSHYFVPRIKNIKQRDVKPFVDAIENGADAIMVGHIVVKSKNKICPASLSKKVIRDIRLKYNFKGLIMTDDLKMKAIRYLYGTKRAVKKAFLAGNDIVLFRFNKKDEVKAFKYIFKLANKGKIKERRINRSVARIIEMKQKYGIDDSFKSNKCNIDEINSRIDVVNAFVEKCEKNI
ncbi:MAG: glycoside hydrolase family 3 protein [Clostridia bacterium]|nr:glycoside hydrolase family 3 protein [Clostridia bacterium]